jgi:CoA binding domain
MLALVSGGPGFHGPAPGSSSSLPELSFRHNFRASTAPFSKYSTPLSAGCDRKLRQKAFSANSDRLLVRNLRAGGFTGRIMLVNPTHAAIDGEPCYSAVESLPDLSIIATPPDTVPGLITALGARGTKAVVVITAGFGEGAAARGQALRQVMLDAARPHLLRIVGPNCLGIMVPSRGLLFHRRVHTTGCWAGVAFIAGFLGSELVSPDAVT